MKKLAIKNPNKRRRAKSFKDRLLFLMDGDRPYAWTRKVGIDKGLFQYYWQKGGIPTYDNLVKIKKYTGCSLDWLITGDGDPFPMETDRVKKISENLIDEIDELIYKLRDRRNKIKSV